MLRQNVNDKTRDGVVIYSAGIAERIHLTAHEVLRSGVCVFAVLGVPSFSLFFSENCKITDSNRQITVFLVVITVVVKFPTKVVKCPTKVVKCPTVVMKFPTAVNVLIRVQ